MRELNSPKEKFTLTILCQVGMFLFKEDLSLITRRLSFSYNTNVLFSLVNTLKLSKDVE